MHDHHCKDGPGCQGYTDSAASPSAGACPTGQPVWHGGVSALRHFCCITGCPVAEGADENFKGASAGAGRQLSCGCKG